MPVEPERPRAGRRSGPQAKGSVASSSTSSTLTRDRDPSDPHWQVVELAQRGRIILDVTAADLEAAEAAHGPFHPTAWHFRNAWYEARKSWERLRADFGGATLEGALAEPPLTVMALGPSARDYGPDQEGRWPLPRPAPGAPVLVFLIRGQTYSALRVAGTPLAPLLWRLLRLHPHHEDGPYFAGRLLDQSTQCDCAEWTYQIAGNAPPETHCKHLAALATLGWL